MLTIVEKETKKVYAVVDDKYVVQLNKMTFVAEDLIYLPKSKRIFMKEIEVTDMVLEENRLTKTHDGIEVQSVVSYRAIGLPAKRKKKTIIEEHV